MRKITINEEWQFGYLPNEQIDQVENKKIEAEKYETISVPHTWYNDENQYVGLCMYRKMIKTDNVWEKAFLEFEGVDRRCKVYIDGVFAGEHDGGYARFRILVPEQAWKNESFEVTVFVDNSPSDTISPLTGDFTIFGGIYREVSLIMTGKTHFDYLYYGTDGVIVRTTLDDNGEGKISLEPHVISESENVKILYKLWDKEGQLVGEEIASSTEETTMVVSSPCVWNGQASPNLYRLTCEVCEGEKITDMSEFAIGFRNLQMEHERFLLNHEQFRMNGVAKHQDFAGVYSAAGKEQIDIDFKYIKDIGANAIRLSHYQHPQYTYDRCDEEGYVVWAEIPMLKMNQKPELMENAKQQMTELILQNIHHPSICFWGIQNEIGMYRDAPYMHDNCEELYQLTKNLDSERIVSCANLYTVKAESKLNQITDMVGYNLYYGWYYGEMKDYDAALDQLHEVCVNKPLMITEYGVDCNVKFHSEQPVVRDYTEEFQALFHETVYPIFESKEYLWGSFIWNMFDFSSARRHEGGVDNINQKGLVTYDRKICKDAYFYYKAKWSKEMFLHICSKRFEKRHEEKIDIKVYTNIKELELFSDKNAEAIAVGRNNGNGTVVFSGVKLENGNNSFTVKGENAGQALEDHVTFIHVEEPEAEYILPDAGAGQKVKNWFLEDEEIERDGCFSVKDTLQDISENEEAMKILEKHAPDTADDIRRDDGIPFGMELLTVLQYDKTKNVGVNIKDLNEELHSVKK